jgi:hypothetical protein
VSTTFERLRKAEAVLRGLSKNVAKSKLDKETGDHPSVSPSKTAVGENDATKIYQKIDDHMRKVGLAKEQIEQKGLKELKNALVLISAYMKKPDSYLGLNLDEYSSRNNFEIQIQDTLIERKKMLLQRYSALTTRQKILQINGILDTLEDKAAREAIKRKLIQISIVDQFVQKEFRSLQKDNILASP